MPTEHTQMHDGKCERCTIENPEREGEFRKWEGAQLKQIIKILIKNY